MFPLGFFLVAFGAYLADCAIKNRGPLTTLQTIIRNPSNMRDTLRNTAGTGYVPTPVANVSGSGVGSNAGSATAESAVVWARTQIGKPYQWGATGPNAYDCSGLVQAAYKHVGVNLPRTSYQQLTIGEKVSKSGLSIGDLVFPDPGHVQLYSGNGNVIEAPHTGAFVREVPMWGFMTARRVIVTPHIAPNHIKGATT